MNYVLCERYFEYPCKCVKPLVTYLCLFQVTIRFSMAFMWHYTSPLKIMKRNASFMCFIK